MILTLTMMAVFNGALFYGYKKMGHTPSSISAIWFSDVNLVYRISLLVVSYLMALHEGTLMDLASLGVIALLVFPNIENAREKLVHDLFAISTFAFMALEVNVWMLLLLILLFYVGYVRYKISLYWMEIIGFNLITTTLIITNLI